MRTVRKLVGALACTALLSVVGVAAAGAQGPGKCNRLASIAARIEEKKARIAARPRAANVGQSHKPNFEIKLQEKVAQLQARCSG